MAETFQSEIAAPADAEAKTWVAQAPAAARPYLRLMRADRPVGTWLLLIPCWQGAALALATGKSDGTIALWHALLFAIGAFVMRGAGCAYNDIVDRDFDAKVARTAHRPIPSGQISLRSAWIFLVALSLAGLVVLLQFNPFTIYLGFGSLVLIAAYPFMKRITWWPQAWLGLTFNWGALVGYAAAAGALSRETIALYAAGFFWTLGYDTIYAHQDKEDDALIGVKSSALRLGERTKPALMIFSALTVVLLAIAAWLDSLNAIFLAALAAAALHLTWQTCAVRLDDPQDCLAKFRSNRLVGWAILAGIIAARLA
jgi:4-hydroxybenzoate polyprenyltransferase